MIYIIATCRACVAIKEIAMKYFNNIHPKSTFLIVLTVVMTIIVSYTVGRLSAPSSQRPPETAEADHNHEKETIWTCSMHPQIRQPEPGQCPICGMDLIPVTGGDATTDAGPRELVLTEAAAKRASIEVSPVERRLVERTINMLGKVTYDETRIKRISSWIPGRIDRMYVDYTGVSVREGDHLVDIFSPDLYAAQEEYLQALQANRELSASSLVTIRETSSATLDAARRKLTLLGLNDTQIEAIKKRGTPQEHVTIYSTAAGIVVDKVATTGMYMNTGGTMYTVADLSHVWVTLDVYESDLPWIRYGQKVIFESEAYPGKTFTGRIAFVDPVVDNRTRTVKVRVNVTNEHHLLKPDMFVRAVVSSKQAAEGKIIDPELAKSYICPMHPEIISETPGDCPLCGMNLVAATELGYVAASTEKPPLIIPRTAPLITGKRAVVYVKTASDRSAFTGREIELGPKAGDYYIVKSGLVEGELVVTSGNFKIDSSLQIQAKPSMMSPDDIFHFTGAQDETMSLDHDEHENAAHDTGMSHDTSPSTEHEHAEGGVNVQSYDVSDTFRTQLKSVYKAYFDLQYALSHDNVANAREYADNIMTALKNVDMTLLDHDPHMAWMKELGVINENVSGIAKAESLEDARKFFNPLSQAMIRVTRMFGHTGDSSYYLFHCPMAFDNAGADWIQNKDNLENPYFGSAMFKCGTLRTEFPQSGK